MHPLVLDPLAYLHTPDWFPRIGHQVRARVAVLWARWRQWEYRREAVWFAVIGLLLLIYAWMLFTGSVARRH